MFPIVIQLGIERGGWFLCTTSTEVVLVHISSLRKDENVISGVEFLLNLYFSQYLKIEQLQLLSKNPLYFNFSFSVG